MHTGDGSQGRCVYTTLGGQRQYVHMGGGQRQWVYTAGGALVSEQGVFTSAICNLSPGLLKLREHTWG